MKYLPAANVKVVAALRLLNYALCIMHFAFSTLFTLYNIYLLNLGDVKNGLYFLQDSKR